MQPILFLLARLMTTGSARQLGSPRLLKGFTPLPAKSWSITGVSRDSTGAALGGCTCTLFKADTTGPLPRFTQYGAAVSDGSGNFAFIVGADGPWRVTFDLDGAPVRAGITLKTLAGT